MTKKSTRRRDQHRPSRRGPSAERYVTTDPRERGASMPAEPLYIETAGPADGVSVFRYWSPRRGYFFLRWAR